MESTVNCWNKTKNNGPKLGKNTKTKIQQETMNMLFFKYEFIIYFFKISICLYTARCRSETSFRQRRQSPAPITVWSTGTTKHLVNTPCLCRWNACLIFITVLFVYLLGGRSFMVWTLFVHAVTRPVSPRCRVRTINTSHSRIVDVADVMPEMSEFCTLLTCGRGCVWTRIVMSLHLHIFGLIMFWSVNY